MRNGFLKSTAGLLRQEEAPIQHNADGGFIRLSIRFGGQSIRIIATQVQSENAQLRDGFTELPVAVLPGTGIQRDRKMGFAFQDIFNQVGQDVLRTELDKYPPALGVNGFDFVLETDRIQDVVSQHLANLFRDAWISLTGGVRINGNAGRLDFGSIDDCGERLLSMRNQTGMERSRYRQRHDRIAFFNQVLLHGCNGWMGPGQHHLGGGIPVRQGDFGKGL